MFTDENDAIRPLLRHLIENHKLKRIAFLARTGGDEFLAVLPGADAAAAESFMRDFDRELEALNRQENRAFDVKASSGAAVRRLDLYSTVEEFVRESDEVMYRQKEERHAQRET